MRTLWQGLLPLLPTLTSSLTPCLALFLSNIAKCAILLWHPTPVLLPGKSRGWRSLEGCSPWGRWGSDTTERLHFHFSLSRIGEGNGNPLQCSCLENPRDGGAWWAAVYGVAQSRARLKWFSSSSSREFYFLLSVCDRILYLVFKTLHAPFANVGVPRFFYPGYHKFVLFKPWALTSLPLLLHFQSLVYLMITFYSLTRRNFLVNKDLLVGQKMSL